MGLSPESDIEDYWKTTRKRAVDYFAVREHISKTCWQQIDLKLYISFPKDLGDPAKELPFDKVITLSNTLRGRFWQY